MAPTKRKGHAMKVCLKCTTRKRLDEFHRNCSTNDGLQSYCKDCQRDINLQYARAHRDVIDAQQKRYRERHPETNTSRVIQYYQDHPERLAAHNAVRRALRDGTLVRPAQCPVPGCRSNRNIVAHHEDYSKPLEVEWMCQSCHQTLHWERRKAQ